MDDLGDITFKIFFWAAIIFLAVAFYLGIRLWLDWRAEDSEYERRSTQEQVEKVEYKEPKTGKDKG